LEIKNKILVLLFFTLCSNSFFGQTDDSLKINYNYINSSPQNAEVYLDYKLIGSTPLFYKWEDSTYPKQLTIKLDGYIDFTETIKSPALIKKTYKLVPKKGTVTENPVKEDKATYFNKPRKVLPIAISAVAAVGAGIYAFYFKSLAGENRDEYELTGNPEALDRKKKYDTYAGISLVVFQVGLGALIYFLLID
jgi:hypothetical protein